MIDKGGGDTVDEQLKEQNVADEAPMVGKIDFDEMMNEIRV